MAVRIGLESDKGLNLPQPLIMGLWTLYLTSLSLFLTFSLKITIGATSQDFYEHETRSYMKSTQLQAGQSKCLLDICNNYKYCSWETCQAGGGCEIEETLLVGHMLCSFREGPLEGKP